MFLLFQLLFLILVSKSNAKYDELKWSYCSALNDIEIVKNTINPMPIVFPNSFEWDFDANLKRQIDGPLRSNITIVRQILGLNLPIRCYLIHGEYAGSCVYPDFCKSLMYILNLNKDTCPESFKQNGVDCTCPFNLNPGKINLVDIIQTYSPVFLDNNWLVVGDYSIRVDVSDKRGHLFCLDVAFTLSS